LRDNDLCLENTQLLLRPFYFLKVDIAIWGLIESLFLFVIIRDEDRSGVGYMNDCLVEGL
jgi:hypothetical protein